MGAADDLPRDMIVNTLHFENTGAPIPIDLGSITDPTTLAHDCAQLFANQPNTFAGCKDFTCKLYDIGKPEPRVPIAVRKVSRDPSGVPNVGGPREIALCLSYAASGAGPRRRGRIYVGPWNLAGRTPDVGQQNQLVTFAHGIADLGGTDIKWSVFSPTTAATNGVDSAYFQVESVWVDNEWDTVRSRGRKPTSRVTATFEG